MDAAVWNQKHSSVVCRQLGCGSAVSTELRDGSTEQPTWKIDSNCVGSELRWSMLRECGLMESGTLSYTLILICSGNKQ